MREQAGRDWATIPLDELLQRMFNASAGALDPQRTLATVVASAYGGDGEPFGYSPLRVAGGTTRQYHRH